jgi:hypothetical protein
MAESHDVDSIQFGPEQEVRLAVQQLRLLAFDHDCYELDEDEGFRCPDCDWRGLSAPMSDKLLDDTDICVKCPRCNQDGLDNGGDVDAFLQSFYESYEQHVERLQDADLDNDVLDEVDRHVDRITTVEDEHEDIDLRDDE